MVGLLGVVGGGVHTVLEEAQRMKLQMYNINHQKNTWSSLNVCGLVEDVAQSSLGGITNYNTMKPFLLTTV